VKLRFLILQGHLALKADTLIVDRDMYVCQYRTPICKGILTAFKCHVTCFHCTVAGASVDKSDLV